LRIRVGARARCSRRVPPRRLRNERNAALESRPFLAPSGARAVRRSPARRGLAPTPDPRSRRNPRDHRRSRGAPLAPARPGAPRIPRHQGSRGRCGTRAARVGTERRQAVFRPAAVAKMRCKSQRAVSLGSSLAHGTAYVSVRACIMHVVSSPACGIVFKRSPPSRGFARSSRAHGLGCQVSQQRTTSAHIARGAARVRPARSGRSLAHPLPHSRRGS
jgi:hypothetical protein